MPVLASRKTKRTLAAVEQSTPEVLSQEIFLKVLALEQRRTERSRRPFVLMLLESGSLLANGKGQEAVKQILFTLSKSTRATDVIGWYEDKAVIGTIFTEIGDTGGRTVANALLTKLTSALCDALTIEQINQIKLSFFVFPDDWDDRLSGNGNGNGAGRVSALYTDKVNGGPGKGALVVKRAIDIIGSLMALILLSPVLFAIALAVRLSSKGPIIFRQQRIGQYGHPFTFLKFRSMYPRNDTSQHQQFVTAMIKGDNGAGQSQNGKVVYKITDDPRITPVGKFLRRTSLDELPQFLNVLLGEMSLVGPRPPVIYEVKSYDIWHRRRLLPVKPGITGLWQVEGRSKVGFADMVRLDLKYAKNWSVWLDLKILLRTPSAMVGGGH